MVLSGRSARKVPCPPASAGQRPAPWPNSPWQAAQRSWKISSPCLTVPRPGGRPLPSGRTSVSHAAISSGSATRPSPSLGEDFSTTAPFGLSAGPALAAPATIRPATTAAPHHLAQLDILGLPVGAHQPGLYAV